MVLNITITDRVSGAPLQGATVYVTGINSVNGATDANGFISLDSGANVNARIMVEKAGYKTRSVHFLGTVGVNPQLSTYALAFSTPPATAANTGLYNTSFSLESWRDIARLKFMMKNLTLEEYRPNEPKRVSFRGLSLEKFRSVKKRKLIHRWS